jgi:hypothetical protein
MPEDVFRWVITATVFLAVIAFVVQTVLVHQSGRGSADGRVGVLWLLRLLAEGADASTDAQEAPEK